MDLEAAFEAVKGLLFGAPDPAAVKLKFNELNKEAKDKREVETNPLSVLGQSRENRQDRDRKERDHQHLTLTALLASNAAYRAAHERALEAFAGAGNAIDGAIEAGEKAHAEVTGKIEDYLASTARLKDGRYVMFDEEAGIYRDQNFVAIAPEDVVEVEGQTIKPILPYERMMEWKEKVAAELDKQRGRRQEVGEWQNEARDNKNPTKQDLLEERTERSSEYEKDAREAHKGLTEAPEFFGEERGALKEVTELVSATMVMPPMP